MEKAYTKLYSLMESLKKSMEIKLDYFDLSRAEFTLMTVLSGLEMRHYSATTKDISEYLQITKPAVSQMLNALEEKGYIYREINKDDRRIVFIKLTEAGHKKVLGIHKHATGQIKTALEMMGEEDSRKLVELITKLKTILDELDNVEMEEKIGV